MSTDYDMVCDECRLRIHAGQESAGVPSFGHNSQDIDGRSRVATFAFEHAWHGQGVRIVLSDVAECRPLDSYTRPEWDL